MNVKFQHQAAEEDLVRLRDLSPSEPNVVLLLGQVYRLLGKASLATRMLVVARDLDPKNAPKLEKLLGASTRNRPGGPGGTGAVAATTTTSTGTGGGERGRSATVGGGDMSVEGAGSSVDESMDASMD